MAIVEWHESCLTCEKMMDIVTNDEVIAITYDWLTHRFCSWQCANDFTDHMVRNPDKQHPSSNTGVILPKKVQE